MRIRHIALGIWVYALSVSSVLAATLIVTTTADSGAGSLRDTIAAANSGDTIQFAATLKGQTITLTSAELLIDKDLTISGPGATQLTVKRGTGATAFRIFEITPGPTVTIQGLTLSSGFASNDFGGAIYNNTSTLTIANDNWRSDQQKSSRRACLPRMTWKWPSWRHLQQGGDVLVRVLGPSLAEAGVPTVLEFGSGPRTNPVPRQQASMPF